MFQLSWCPPAWRGLVHELNGRPIDGTDGIRDVDAPCEEFRSEHTPRTNPGSGRCDTDGHYLCVECPHISLEAIRGRRDECAECGGKLELRHEHQITPDFCPRCLS